MIHLLLKKFRCFSSPKQVPLAPLTLVVGENSSGKTSLLAAIRFAFDIVQGNTDLDFNEEPFVLGAFDEIVTRKNQRHGRSFEIGMDFESPLRASQQAHHGVSRNMRITSSFVSRAGQPQALEWRLEHDQYRLIFTMRSGEGPNLVIDTGSEQLRARFKSRRASLFRLMPQLRFMLRHLGDKELRTTEGVELEGEIRQVEHWEFINKLLFRLEIGARSRPRAIAPIRTKPERTYDLLKDTPRPEGGHVPMYLAKLASSEESEWQKLKKALGDFGQASDLFKAVDVKRLGRTQSGPFQVQVEITGGPMNLMDVGYGVSQVLPILVDTLTAEEGATFLLQQPEVHLHPKAQAELATFLGTLVKTRRMRFVVETHSDFIIDRIRTDVRDGSLFRPEDVVILYLEREPDDVNIHPLEVDVNGNLDGAPPGYRSFFMEEEKRFLGV